MWIQLAALDETARAAAMSAPSVRKEALLKAAGVGLAVSMESFATPENHALQVRALFDGMVQVRTLDAGESCVAAVAGVAGAVGDCRGLRPAFASLADASATQSSPASHNLGGGPVEAR